MKHLLKRRAIAMILFVATVLTALIPCTVSAAPATTAGTETTEDLYGGRTIDEILDLIGGTTYDRYVSTNSNHATSSVEKKNPIVLTTDDIVEPGDADFIDDKTGEERTTADYKIESSIEGIDPIYDANGNPSVFRREKTAVHSFYF